MKKLLLFDLDGTLLITHGAGVRAMSRAGRRIWGERFSLSELVVSGGLDPLLVAEALAAIGLRLTPECHAEFQVLYEQELRLELQSARPRPEALPGVRDLLVELRRDPRITLGILTGNYAPTANLKLRSVGFNADWFEVHAWGNDAPTRPALVQHALLLNSQASPENTLVIGDTPRDVHCALQNGCRSMAVATGEYSADDLRTAGADWVVDNLQRCESLWRFLDERA